MDEISDWTFVPFSWPPPLRTVYYPDSDSSPHHFSSSDVQMFRCSDIHSNSTLDGVIFQGLRFARQGLDRLLINVM